MVLPYVHRKKSGYKPYMSNCILITTTSFFHKANHFIYLLLNPVVFLYIIEQEALHFALHLELCMTEYLSIRKCVGEKNVIKNKSKRG